LVFRAHKRCSVIYEWSFATTRIGGNRGIDFYGSR
jgi:hypothetical protein